MANRYGVLPGSTVHTRTLPADVPQPPGILLRPDPAPGTHSGSYPRLQGSQNRGGSQSQHRRRDAGGRSTALNQAVDDALIPSNPASRVKKAATHSMTPMRSLSQEEASRLLGAAMGKRDEALLTLARRSGMRQGELAALRWEDVDFTGKSSIIVRRSADTRTKT